MKDREYTDEEVTYGMRAIEPYARLAGTSDKDLNDLAEMYIQAIEDYRKKGDVPNESVPQIAITLPQVEQNIRNGRRMTLISSPFLYLSLAGLGYSMFKWKNQNDSNKETTTYIAAASTFGYAASFILTALGRVIWEDNKVTRRRLLGLPEPK